MKTKTVFSSIILKAFCLLLFSLSYSQGSYALFEKCVTASWKANRYTVNFDHHTLNVGTITEDIALAIVPEIREFLAAGNVIDTLNVAEHLFSTDSALAIILGAFLHPNVALDTLTIRLAKRNYATMVAIANILEKNRKIHVLHFIQTNPTTFSDFTNEDLLELAAALQGNDELLELVFEKHFGQQDSFNAACKFIDALTKNRNLVNLRVNLPINNAVAIRLARVIALNPRLNALLIHNPADDCDNEPTLRILGEHVLLRAIEQNIHIVNKNPEPLDHKFLANEHVTILLGVLQRNKKIGESGLIEKISQSLLLAEQRTLAVLGGHHPRLGAASPIATLPPAVLQEIVRLSCHISAEEMHHVILETPEETLAKFLTPADIKNIREIRRLQKEILQLLKRAKIKYDIEDWEARVEQLLNNTGVAPTNATTIMVENNATIVTTENNTATATIELETSPSPPPSVCTIT